jgi:hypothetical protein
MISKGRSFVAALVLSALATVPAEATSITVTIGNASPPFANAAVTTTAAALAAQTGAGAFSGACGADPSSNCLASWTFNFLVPVGEVVTSGSVTLGLVDLDSKAAGLQINNFSITGGDNLTVPFNTAAEAIQSLNNQYNVFTLPLTSLAVFNGGTATVNLALQGPGQGVLPTPTNFNGAILIYSQLNLTSAPDRPTNPVPEPASTAMLLAASVGILARARAHTRAR